MKAYTTVGEYIESFPLATQKVLRKFRSTIRHAAPKATERIAYGIPTYTGNKNLVHFGGFATHVSFFPGGSARAQFKELTKYSGGKGTIKFMHGQPIPWALVTKVVKARVKQDKGK